MTYVNLLLLQGKDPKKVVGIVQNVQLDYSEFFDENAGQTKGTVTLLLQAAFPLL